MVKLTFFIRRHPDWSHADFAAYWGEHHARLISRHAAAFGIRRYVQVHRLDHPRNEPTEAFPERFDGVAELHFASRAHLELWFDNATPETAAAGREIRADERRFIDRAHSPYLIGEERTVVGEE